VVVGELFAAHGRMVLGLCRLLLRDPAEAEDAAQQVFLSAHRAVLGGSAPREAPAWLAAIARNECRARIRARMREPLALPELPSDLPDPLASAIRALDLDAIWAALSSLPRRQRRALLLRELGGLSYHELGIALGVSQSAVESLLFRARQQLRSVLTGANAAAVPLALRDELARLIPGCDPASVGIAARVATLPVAAKLATAAVGVGVVATGASQLPQHRARPAETRASVTRPSVVRPEPREQLSALLVGQRPSRTWGAEPPARRRDGEDAEAEREPGEVQRERAEREVAEREPLAPERAERTPAVHEPHEAEEEHDQAETESGGD
jgi:RNA polymerase sigma factor (sigma-70 family)